MTAWKRIGARIDDRIGAGAEKAGRFVSRRAALRTAILTGATAIGSLALGKAPAFAAVRCPESCGPSPLCSQHCPPLGCPAHHSLCKVRGGKNPCPGLCVWPNGTWVHCVGYGNCGEGFKLCQDCKPSGSCNICICISAVLCRQCCTPQDVRNERQWIDSVIAVS